MEPEPSTRVIEPPAARGGAVRGAVERHPSEAAVAAADPGGRHDAARAVEPAGPARLVGRYELVHRLGHGGMATVYLARATGRAGFEKLVAVKVIHPHLASEPDFVEMFLDEARIAARIHHPHVVEILDLGEAEGVSFMVLEYVEGPSLAALARAMRAQGERMSVAEALRVIADALQGLHAAHELTDPSGQPYALVHRDISPQNLIVDRHGWVRVMDFGIMKAAGKRSSTLTGQLRGKLPYMSPEQIKGLPTDRRTDLFALAVVAWELLTGEGLFHAETDGATIERVSACVVPDLRAHVPEASDALAEWLRSALQADPEQRPATAAQMLSSLRPLLRDAPGADGARASLAARVERHCGTQLAYAHAALRSRGDERSAGAGSERRRTSRIERGSPAEPLVLASTFAANTAGAAEVDASTPVEPSGTPDHAGRTDDDSAPGRARRDPTAALEQVAAADRRWRALVLPAVAAGLAVAATLAWVAPAPQRVPPASVAAPATSDPAPTAAQDPTILWVFNTDPQGATVHVGDAGPAGVTPFEARLDRSEQRVRVTIAKEGFRQQELWLVPLASQNFLYALQPAATATVPDPSVATPAVFQVAPRARAAGDSAGGSRERKKPKAATQPPAPRVPGPPSGTDERGLKGLPADFQRDGQGGAP